MSGGSTIEFPCLVMTTDGYIYACPAWQNLATLSRKLVHEYVGGQIVDVSGTRFEIKGVRVVGPAPYPLMQRLANFIFFDRSCVVDYDLQALGRVDVDGARDFIDSALALAVDVERRSKQKYHGDDEAFSIPNQIKRIRRRVKTAENLQELLRRIVKMQG